MNVALVNNQDFTVWQFRRGLIAALVERGARVSVITPPGPYTCRLEALGARHVCLPFEQYVSPAGDVRLLATLYRLFVRERFDIVHNITIKPNIYGSFAARAAGVPRIVSLVPGLGHVFAPATSVRSLGMRSLAMGLMGAAFRANARVWFQNRDDLDYFVQRHVVPQEKAVLIRGSGVDLDEYSLASVDDTGLARLRAELALDPRVPVVTMAARTYWSKGVGEFIAAAQRVSQERRVKFLLAGAAASGTDAAPAEYLRRQQSEAFEWLGFRSDVRELIALSAIVVLPSYYREGVPRSLLEALAMGKPIVTADTIGCREVVDHGRNGYLVPPRDAEALARAILRVLGDEALRRAFGRESRRKAEAEFDEAQVVERVLHDLYEW